MEELVHGQGKRMEKTRCFYTTCPKCPNIMARTTWSPWQGCSSSASGKHRPGSVEPMRSRSRPNMQTPSCSYRRVELSRSHSGTTQQEK